MEQFFPAVDLIADLKNGRNAIEASQTRKSFFCAARVGLPPSSSSLAMHRLDRMRTRLPTQELRTNDDLTKTSFAFGQRLLRTAFVLRLTASKLQTTRG